jgi:hypothetical protein
MRQRQEDQQFKVGLSKVKEILYQKQNKRTFFIVLLFICAYNAWVISPPCPHPLPYHPLPPSPPHPLDTRQKLFCPYL